MKQPEFDAYELGKAAAATIAAKMGDLPKERLFHSVNYILGIVSALSPEQTTEALALAAERSKPAGDSVDHAMEMGGVIGARLRNFGKDPRQVCVGAILGVLQGAVLEEEEQLQVLQRAAEHVEQLELEMKAPKN